MAESMRLECGAFKWCSNTLQGSTQGILTLPTCSACEVSRDHDSGQSVLGAPYQKAAGVVLVAHASRSDALSLVVNEVVVKSQRTNEIRSRRETPEHPLSGPLIPPTLPNGPIAPHRLHDPSILGATVHSDHGASRCVCDKS